MYLEEKLTQEVKKEDCMGNALCGYQNKMGAVLSDGKGTGGKDV